MINLEFIIDVCDNETRNSLMLWQGVSASLQRVHFKLSRIGL